MQRYNRRPGVRYGKILVCTTNYSVMITALCFCDGTQLSQTFRMHVFADGYLSVLQYKVVQFTVFALKIRHSNFRQEKIFVQVYSNPDEFPVSLISAI